ncbi:4e7280bf-23a9-48ed-be84-bf445a2814bb [Sclerotinia trifoliorum]|uniref:4e7280bf-23a9-48ed-be84-bf445a2814bb n=1 Tax=Sclerotinia trifoliorum TaxID=28548 RepID=A0A8H2ZQT3_9HELO|nr:4e7280bf-23a9-48ed-be84-bf445a2814bb [Sclerotinia trifoliorum]
MKMETKSQEDGNGERAGVVVESTKPRVRLPVMTQGIINPVAITQLQDELEDTKKELDRLQATRMLSEDEIILSKRMSLLKLIGMFPAVGDQIHFKMGQKLNDLRKEYEAKIKRSKDEHHDNHSRDMAIVREMELKLFKAEERLNSLGTIAKMHPNATGTIEPKPIYKSERNTELKPHAQFLLTALPPITLFEITDGQTAMVEKGDMMSLQMAISAKVPSG